MVTLRPTRKLRSLLRLAESEPGYCDTALGDWYVNRLVVDRQPLLLLVRARAKITTTSSSCTDGAILS